MILSCNSGGINFPNIDKVAPTDGANLVKIRRRAATYPIKSFTTIDEEMTEVYIYIYIYIYIYSVVELWDHFDEQQLCTETEVWVGCGVSDQ